jgi:hypothetical protein
MHLDGVWWARWSTLKKLVVAKRVPNFNIREELGQKPTLKIVAIALGTGAFFFVYVLLGVRVVEKGTLRNALIGATVTGAIFGLAFVGVAAFKYWNSPRVKPGPRRGGRRATKALLAGAE